MLILKLRVQAKNESDYDEIINCLEDLQELIKSDYDHTAGMLSSNNSKFEWSFDIDPDKKEF